VEKGNNLKQIHIEKQLAYYENTLHQNLRPESTQYILRQINELVSFGKLTPNSRVLEVGCGVGRYTLNLPTKKFKVDGLDLSEYNLNKLNEFNGGEFDIGLHCCDLASIPDDLKEKYDAVIGFFVLHHLLDLKSCFEAIYKTVKPGGTVVFLEPNPYNILFYIGITFTSQGSWSVDKGIVNMRKAKLFKIMAEAGFDELGLMRFGMFPPYLVNQNWGRKLEAVIERFLFAKPFLAFQLFMGKKPMTNRRV